MARILVVEDELGIRLAIEDRFRAEGYEVVTAEDGLEGYAKAREGGIDLIVLDLMLPRRDGLEVCRDLRREGIVTPVLVLSAKGTLEDRVGGLRTGADDYLVKPFAMLELLARVEALLRRDRITSDAGRPKAHSFGQLRLDEKSARVTRNGEPVRLSAKEYQLLLYFVTHPGEALSRSTLLRQVWRHRAELSTRTVDVHVGWLRQKIEDDPKKPRWIVTRHGMGYTFDPGPPSPPAAPNA